MDTLLLINNKTVPPAGRSDRQRCSRGRRACARDGSASPRRSHDVRVPALRLMCASGSEKVFYTLAKIFHGHGRAAATRPGVSRSELKTPPLS